MMKVLNKFTIRSLKLNKRRTLVTITGIILSTALICAVSGLVSSFRQTLINSAINNFGNCHVIFQNITADESKYITSNRNIKDTYTVIMKGWAEYTDCARKGTNTVDILAYNDKAYEDGNIRFVQGVKPANGNEIAVTEEFLKNNKNSLKLGDTINFNVQEYTRDKEDSNNIKEQDYSYKLVGIIDDKVTKVSGGNDYYAITTYNEEELDKAKYIQVFALFDDVSTYKEDIKSINSAIKKTAGASEEEAIIERVGKDEVNKETEEEALDQSKAMQEDETLYYGYMCNNDLLRWIGVGFSDSIMSALYAIGALVILIVIVSSIFVIRNGFEISVAEKMKQYGVLSSVGATSKQIRYSVIFEGLILSIISIPLGIIIGSVVVGILIAVMNHITPAFLNYTEFVWTVSVMAIIITIILALITILLSSLSAARRASKVSPIESIRNSEKIKSKKIKSPKIVKKLFGVSGDIAYKNLKRSRKKYRTTVISIIVSVVIFIVTQSFIDYGIKMQSVYYTDYNYNVFVHIDSDYTDTERAKIIERLTSFDDINISGILREATTTVNKEHFTDFLNQVLEYNGEDTNKNQIGLSIVAIGDAAYKQYLDELGESYEECKNKAILLDEQTVVANKKRYNGHIYDYKTGDKININYEGNNVTDIEIEKRTDLRPIGLESTYTTGGYILVSDECFDKLVSQGVEPHKTNYLFIDSNNPDALADKITELTENNSLFAKVSVMSMNKLKEQSDAMSLIVEIFLYGFLAVITLIGVTNIFNTITTNMNLRSKELAMLKSVGMTNKEFGKMIRLESFFYGSKSLLIGLPIGIGLSFMMYKAFEYGMEMEYIFPFKSVVIAILFVMIVVSLIMNYSVKKIGNQNIIETIRKDNI